jgi:hypothetical protein
MYWFHFEQEGGLHGLAPHLGLGKKYETFGLDTLKLDVKPAIQTA